jgi:hypothetical protein
VPAHDLAHGAFDPFLLGRVEMTEKRGVIFVRECRKLRQQRPPLRGDCQGLIAPILDAGRARHERLGFKPVGELRDRAAGHADPLGERARRHRLAFVQFPQHHPLGDGDAAFAKLEAERMRDLVRDEAQPVAEMRFQRADRYQLTLHAAFSRWAPGNHSTWQSPVRP